MVVDDKGAPRKRLTRAESKANTRARLLEAAAQVFAQKGFAGASVEEIAETAGYSFGALYSNFESKEQLFLELQSNWLAESARTVAETFEAETEGDGDPLTRLSHLLVEIADKNPEMTQLQAEFWLYAVRKPDAMQGLAARTHDQVAALEALVAPAMARLGVSSEVSPTAVTTLVLALFQGLVRHRRIDPTAVPDDLLAQGLRWLFTGLVVAPVRPAPDAPGHGETERADG